MALGVSLLTSLLREISSISKRVFHDLCDHFLHYRVFCLHFFLPLGLRMYTVTQQAEDGRQETVWG